MFLIGSAVIYVETQNKYTCNVTKIDIGVVEVVIHFNIIERKEERILVKVFQTDINKKKKKEWIKKFKIGDKKTCWIDQKNNVYLNKLKPPGALTMILVAGLVSLCCFCLPLLAIMINSYDE